MKNRFVKSGLDLEAKMNELDQKAEKEKDVQDRTASLDKFLEELSTDLLVMKNAVSLIDEGNHRFKKANEDFGNVLNKYENIIKESKQFVDDVTRIGITSNISEESMKEVGTIFDDHYKLLLDFRKELSEELRFRIDDFLDREKETAGNFATETQKLLANFNEDLSRTLSHSGFWCTSKVFAWLLGIFGFCLFVTFMTIALLIAGNLQFRVY